MIAAMMLPSSLPLVRLFGGPPRGRPTARARWRPSSAATPSCGRPSARSRSRWTPGCTPRSRRAVAARTRVADRRLGARARPRLPITSLKDGCPDKCRHPAQFLVRYYERVAGGGFRLAGATAPSAWAAAGRSYRDVRRRRREPGLDGAVDHADGARKDPPRRAAARAGDRRRPARGSRRSSFSTRRMAAGA